MNHIVIFCDKTIKEKHDKIDKIDSNFKTKIEKAEYEEIQKTIASKETAKKKKKKEKNNNNNNSTSTEVQEIQQQP